MVITEDLKYIASRYLHNPGSHVGKLRVKRSRSGAEKVLISLDIPIASGPPRPEYYALEIPVRVSSPFFPCIHSAFLTVLLTTGIPPRRLGPQSRTSSLQ